MDYKNQHYIPKTFLKSWEIPNTKSVNFFDRTKNIYKVRNVEKIFNKKFLYSFSYKNIYSMPQQSKTIFYNILDGYVLKNQNNTPFNIDEAIFNLLENVEVYKNNELITKKQKNELKHELENTKDAQIEMKFNNLETKWSKFLDELINFNKDFLRTSSNKKIELLFKKYIFKNQDLILLFAYSLLMRNPNFMEKPLNDLNEIFLLFQKVFSEHKKPVSELEKLSANDGFFKFIQTKLEKSNSKFWQEHTLNLFFSQDANFPVFENLGAKVKNGKALPPNFYFPLTPNFLAFVTKKQNNESLMVNLVDLGNSKQMFLDLIESNEADFVTKEKIDFWY